MKRPIKTSPRQLRLPLEHETPHQPAEQLREELVKVLAELLLEALGEEMTDPTAEQGGSDEREDYL
jgi:hypothetical protein